MGQLLFTSLLFTDLYALIITEDQQKLKPFQLRFHYSKEFQCCQTTILPAVDFSV